MPFLCPAFVRALMIAPVLAVVGCSRPGTTTTVTTSIEINVAATKNHDGVTASLTCEAIRHSSDEFWGTDRFTPGNLVVSVQTQPGADRSRFPGDATFEAQACFLTTGQERPIGSAVLAVRASEADTTESPRVTTSLGSVVDLGRAGTLRLVLYRLSDELSNGRERIETVEVELPNADWAENVVDWAEFDTLLPRAKPGGP